MDGIDAARAMLQERPIQVVIITAYSQRDVIASAVEARHAAWVRDLLYAGKSVKPAPESFSTPMSMSEVLSAVKKTGFIKS